MISLLTNESALVALSTFRGAVDQRDAVQGRVATGLAVAQASDNPAFFLVSRQVEGDLSVVTGIQDNLELAIQTVATAEAGVSLLDESLDRITDAIVIADTGIALQELNFAIANEVDFIRGVVANTSFNGVNLLDGSGAIGFTTGVTRAGGEIGFSTSQITGLDLGSTALFGEGSIFTGNLTFVVGTTARAEAQAQFDALVRVHDPELARAFDQDGDGVFTLAGDTFPVGANFAVDASNFTEDQAIYAALSGAPFTALSATVLNPDNFPFANGLSRPNGALSTGAGFQATNRLAAYNLEFRALNDLNGNGVVLLIDNSADDADPTPGSIGFRASDAVLDAFEAFGLTPTSRDSDGFVTFDSQEFFLPSSLIAATPLQFAPVDTTDGVAALPPTLQDDANYLFARGTDISFLREAAEGTGTLALLDRIDLQNPFLSIEEALTFVDVLRERFNLAANNLGVLRQTLEAQQEALGGLADGLNIGIAALIEADLDAEAAELSAVLVQLDLAAEALSIANAQPQILLTLFQ